MKRLIWVVALGGCGFGSTATDVPHDGSNTPPAIDAMVVTPPPIDAASDDAVAPPSLDAQACFGQGLVRVCFSTLPSEPITLTSAMSPYDTSIDANCPVRVTQGGIELCVVAGRSVTVPSAFVAIGARPLVVVGIDDVTIAGDKLTIAGSVFASGGGGAAVNSNAGAEQGGGGGGAGGVIGLDAQMVEVTGRVAANGGAGGGGGGVSTGGKSGEDGSTTMWDMRARHGDTGMSNNSPGADGTAIGKVDMLTPPEGVSGGGGGAGGLGFVKIDGALTGNAQISPAPGA